MSTKALPSDLTSYDLLKTLAVILMIADHVGYFFYPDDMWWRVAGRLCVPIWFFLIGYAQSRDTGWRMWGALLILLISNVFAGMSLVPLNIVGTMLAIRYVIDPVMRAVLVRPQLIWPIAVLAILMIPASSLGFEYGTTGLLLAMTGWLVRRREGLPEPALAGRFLLCSLLVFVSYQYFLFGFTQIQFGVLSCGLMVVMGGLFYFQPQVYPVLTNRIPRSVAFLQLIGRHTLAIYVIHLLLFKGLALWLAPARFILFNWKLFSPTGL